MNFIKRFLIEERTRDRIGALREIKTLERVRISLLPTLNFFIKHWALTNSSYFLIKLDKSLIQKLY